MRTLKCSSLGFALVSLLAAAPALGATTYYVATTGSDAAAGTQAAPWKSVTYAQSQMVAGDTLYIRGGAYSITAGTNDCGGVQTATVNAIALSKSGTAGNLMHYIAYPGETPVFDYTNLMADCRVKGFLVSGSYIHMKGIAVTNVKQRNSANHESWGVWVSGSNNLFEQLDIYHIDGTGFFISGGASNNLVLNCDSHHNFDPLSSTTSGPAACENADGFGAHVNANGTGNVFRGCRSWFNADDDYDVINAFAAVTIEQCWGWHAGYRWDTGAACGNGNGFKCGGYGLVTSTFPSPAPIHVIRQNLSTGNRAAAFYANHHPGNILFYNNTGYASNPDFNMLGITYAGADVTVGTYRNNLAVGGTLTSNANSPDAASNSWTLSVTANASDFQSVSEVGLDGPRQADGSLPVLTNFRLVTGSDLIDKGVNVGLPYAGSAPDLGAFETGLVAPAGGTTSTGGTTSVGGTTAKGGTTSAGGTTAKGGTTSAGGTTAKGGTTSAGGTTAKGGTTSAGGTVAAVGGTTSKGGTSGTLGVGGAVVASGGATVVGVGGGSGSIVAPLGGAAGLGGAGSVAVGGGIVTTGTDVAGVGGALAGFGGAGTATTPTGSDAGEDGCGCSVPASNPSRSGFAVFGLALAVLARRRRAR